MTPIEKDKLMALCAKWKLTELKISKDIFMADDNSGITMNLRGEAPVVGVTIAGTLHTEGHGIQKVQDLQTEVDQIIKFKKKEYTLRHPPGDKIEPPIENEKLKEAFTKASLSQSIDLPATPAQTGDAKGSNPSSEKKLGTLGTSELRRGTTTALCGCGVTFKTTIDEAQDILNKYGKVCCEKCRVQLAKSVKPEQELKPKMTSKPAAIRTCKTCGLELSGERALECFQKDPQKPEMICEECESTQKPQAPEPVRHQMPATRQPDVRIPVQAYNPHGSIIKGFQPSLKEIGKIKIGSKGKERQKQGGGTIRIPVKFDHFEIVSLIRDENGDFVKDPVMQQLSDNPKELDIMLLFNDPTLNFITRYNQYQGGKCLCQGDGATAKQVDGSSVECNPEICPQFAQKKCKPNGILSVILTKSPRLGGVYKFRTTSFNSIRSILSSMFFLSNLTGGVLAMIPLKLTVSPMQVQPKDSAKPQTIYVVNIEFSGTAPELLQKTFEVQKYQSSMRENIIKLESTARAVLTAPETKEEIAEIEAEWYPEQQQQKKAETS